jgi:hypothetical protein
MRRFYICPRTVIDDKVPGRGFPHHRLFHEVLGAHWIDLPGGHILMSTDFNTEACEETWHQNSQVAHLPHPTREGNVSLFDHMQNPEKRFTQAHMDALASIGVSPAHTVWDIHKIASKISPLVKLSSTY